MAFQFSVPTPTGEMAFQVEPGTSLFFVGANGGGKTRLAVKIESDLGMETHRISAHRALTLNPSVAKIGEAEALSGLRIGTANRNVNLSNRVGIRWGNNAAVSLLNDYDFLIQVLFAEQANTSLMTHRNARSGVHDSPSLTKFEKLVEIWDRVLPHRELIITGDDIQARVRGASESYQAKDMSDGERAVFYLIGQTLAASCNSLIIFDEPELHIHRSIMSRLWDEIEASRPDCAVIVISHDLEFVASRVGQKYVLREYNPSTGWAIERVPEESGFTEEVATLILGSRRPVLFVEGLGASLDRAVYRACYPSWTVIPRGSCEEVIHAVVTMRANASLTRVMCSGIVDADAYSSSEADLLRDKGIAVLPVSEIENLFLLPTITRAILESEGFVGDELIGRLDGISNMLFEFATDPKNQLDVTMRYARRRVDRILKTIDLSSASDVDALANEYSTRTAALDIRATAQAMSDAITKSITERDIPALLQIFDNKGLLSIAAQAKATKVASFRQWLVRALMNGAAPSLSDAIQAALPTVEPA
jgi:energy-coupling factor transporter ATP-binding protein EcfA2